MIARYAAIALAALMIPAAASAQSASENFSYKAPSGMFSEGTTKWQLFQFIESDAERTAKLNEGKDVTSTGSLSTSTSNAQSYPRPGEASGGTRRTAR